MTESLLPSLGKDFRLESGERDGEIHVPWRDYCDLYPRLSPRKRKNNPEKFVGTLKPQWPAHFPVKRPGKQEAQ